MNFNLFDDMDGLILRERENSQFHRTNPQRINNPVEGMSGSESAFPAHTPLGMAYVPFQQWGDVYPEDKAFECGTLFPQLNFPFQRGAD